MAFSLVPILFYSTVENISTAGGKDILCGTVAPRYLMVDD